MQNLHLIEFLAEAFQFHVHHFQCLTVLVEPAVMKFVFRSIADSYVSDSRDVSEMCDCVKECMSFVM